MALTLRYRATTTVPVEVEGITPDRVARMSRNDVQQLPIFVGNVSVPLTELFDVSGDPSDGCMDWHGDLSGVHWVGARMQKGQIRIHGPVGRHLGSAMSGGRIDVQGDAGDWVGAELQGGSIHVHGSAGHLVGAAYRGSPRGMTGGTILVDGQAGNEVGHSMRRGLIAIGGAAGDLIGFNMLAGTVFVFGAIGIRHGAGMRRGTLGFFGPKPPLILSTFRYAYRGRPLFVNMLFHHLQRVGFAQGPAAYPFDIDAYHGDLLEGGRGEILLRVTDE